MNHQGKQRFAEAVPFIEYVQSEQAQEQGEKNTQYPRSPKENLSAFCVHSLSKTKIADCIFLMPSSDTRVTFI